MQCDTSDTVYTKFLWSLAAVFDLLLVVYVEAGPAHSVKWHYEPRHKHTPGCYYQYHYDCA